jgi:hypothetical protein
MWVERADAANYAPLMVAIRRTPRMARSRRATSSRPKASPTPTRRTRIEAFAPRSAATGMLPDQKAFE